MIAMMAVGAPTTLVHLSKVDLVIIAFYFLLVLAIGFYLKRFAKTGEDFFLAGREMTAWVAGLAFVSANLGSLELLGWAGNAYQYGIMAAHWYWVGAIPAMVFLGIVMMPFYYISKTHSVPGYLKLRYGSEASGLSAITFAVMTILMSGVNMYAMAVVMEVVLGWNLHFSIVVSSLTVVVQRVLSAKDVRSAKLAPIIGSFFKMAVPLIVILPGLLGRAVLPMHLVPGSEAQAGQFRYDDVLPLMLARYCGPGLLGLGITALVAGFMAGMAGNVSAFATVWTYDLYRPFIRKDAPDRHYVSMGRWCTLIGVFISIGTAYLAMGFASIMDYVQALFGFFIAPLFGTVLLGMLWKRVTRAAGCWGLLAGVVSSVSMFTLMKLDQRWVSVFALSPYAKGLAQAMYQALWSCVTCVVVTVIVTLVTKPRPDEELRGLVYSLTDVPQEQHTSLLQRPAIWGAIAMAIFDVLHIIF